MGGAVAIRAAATVRAGHPRASPRRCRLSIPRQVPWRARQGPARAKARSLRAAAGPTDVFAIDVDGVLVDSEPEVTRAAIAAATEIWPETMAGADEGALRQALRRVRPVIVKGFEAVVQARMLAEHPAPDTETRILSRGAWAAVWREAVSAWGASAEHIDAVFGRIRDAEVAAGTYLEGQRAYPGVVGAMRECPYPSYLVSSKSGKRVAAVLGGLVGMEGVEEGSPRVMASLLPPEEKKVEALRTIMSRPLIAEGGATLHFIDDRVDTLLHAAEVPALSDVKLYLAEWGYCTEGERELARASPRIKVLDLEAFAELLKWGVVMGVDDGCEPTPEEVIKGVHDG
ncbi:unnamed protein product [Pedinophyceae sp. YPF-701]|nr:unnamed protein product [Pedinophyceae sp. YPF-701]